MIIRVPTPFRCSADGYIKLHESSGSTSSSPVTIDPEQGNSPGSDSTKSTRETSAENSQYRPSLNVIAANMAYDCRSTSKSAYFSPKKHRRSSSSASRSSFGVPGVVEFQVSLHSSDKRNKSSRPQAASPPILPASTKRFEWPSRSASTIHRTEGVSPCGIVLDQSTPNCQLNSTYSSMNTRSADRAIQRSDCTKIQPPIKDEQMLKSPNNQLNNAIFFQAYSETPENLSMIVSPVVKKENHTVNVELTDWSLDINFTNDEILTSNIEDGKSDAVSNTDWVAFGPFDESPEVLFSPKTVSGAEATRIFPYPDFMCDEWGDNHVGSDAKCDLVHEKLACQLEMVLGRLVFLENAVDYMGKFIQMKSSTDHRDLSYVDFGLANTGFILEEGDALELSKAYDTGRISTTKRRTLSRLVNPRWLGKGHSNKA
mmetsp:Transcript_18093/g.36548  ORF Transcript_18093/g.36548 Transcript_18093/m.36548 type:complete len:428 (+) Transcript_18093:1298-2581(+)